MAGKSHSPGGAAVTALILEVFRANGALLQAGDALVADLGLTSARWQVLGAAALSDGQGTVSDLARSMGLSRQAVQRLVNELRRDGLLAHADNPRHRRAPLVRLTRRGEAVYAEIDRRQIAWSNALADRMRPDALSAAADALAGIRERLEQS